MIVFSTYLITPRRFAGLYLAGFRPPPADVDKM